MIKDGSHRPTVTRSAAGLGDPRPDSQSRTCPHPCRRALGGLWRGTGERPPVSLSLAMTQGHSPGSEERRKRGSRPRMGQAGRVCSVGVGETVVGPCCH